MLEYKIVLKILTSVIMGKNLTEQFNINLNNVANVDCENINSNTGKIKDISYGVARHYYEIELILDSLIKNQIKDLSIKIILFIAIYELKYTKKPHFAITNDIVNLSYLVSKQERIKNFVNAVIRNFLRNQNKISDELSSNSEYQFNFPIWWIQKLKQDYPFQYITILNVLNLKPKYGIRVNLRKIDLAKYINMLKNDDINFLIIDEKIILETTGNINLIPLFKDGFVSIQDINAQKLIELVPPMQSKSYILDACCAPGGKMAQILEHYDDIDLLGIDISTDRLNKAKVTLNRLGLNATLKIADASLLDWWDGKFFDMIIADVPCSASGTVKKNPDIKLHRKLDDIKNFVMTQRSIIINLWKTLKYGGTLVYITCSIFKEENDLNIDYLKTKLSQFNVIKDLELLPTEYADGFYYCVIQKI